MSMFGYMRPTTFNAATAQSAAEAQSAANSATLRVAALEEHIDKLTLVCAAVWELLREKTGMTEQDLAVRVAMIDARDGVADGKITHTVRPCGKCGRPVAARHRKCMYCGTEQAVEGVFQAL